MFSTSRTVPLFIFYSVRWRTKYDIAISADFYTYSVVLMQAQTLQVFASQARENWFDPRKMAYTCIIPVYESNGNIRRREHTAAVSAESLTQKHAPRRPSGPRSLTVAQPFATSHRVTRCSSVATAFATERRSYNTFRRQTTIVLRAIDHS